MYNQKKILNLKLVDKQFLNDEFFIMKLYSEELLPKINSGQFCQILIENINTVFLRRPISIFDIDYKNNIISLLVKINGKGTAILSDLNKFTNVNIILPLGNFFKYVKKCKKMLLVGGGCGIAPLYYAGKEAKEKGIEIDFILGFKNKKQIILEKEFSEIANVFYTTEDGSFGEKGNVLQHSLFSQKKFNYDKIISCGPEAMMKAITHLARKKNIDCEISLENLMACGIGACLCCVNTKITGTKTVCVDGPVFNIKDLLW